MGKRSLSVSGNGENDGNVKCGNVIVKNTITTIYWLLVT